MLLRLFTLAAIHLLLIRADVEFTSPAPGDKATAGSAITVEWDDGNGKTPLAKLAGYQIFLVAGGNSDSTSQLLPAIDGVAGDHSLGKKSAKITPSAADGPPGQNAYYLKIVSAKTGGGQVINYSQRFTISGMTGKWQSPAIQSAYQSAASSPSSVPPTVDGNAPAGAGGGAGDGQDYTAQSGPMRYAPMQQAPPTAITAQNTKPLFPVSGFQVAVTYLPTPEAQTTITASRTQTYETKENPASPAPLPGQDGSNNAGGSGGSDMAKFLRRWED